MPSVTEPKKSQESSSRKSWFKLSYLGPIGWIMAAIGLVLTPFLIGLPILTLGWMLVVFDFFYSLYANWVPDIVQRDLAQKLKQEYKPYRPAAKSLGSLLLDMLKVAGIVFFGAIIALLFFYRHLFGF